MDGQTRAGGDLAPDPHLRRWYERGRHDLRNRRCLLVGCARGDDAEYLAAAGGLITACDRSPTTVDWCRDRFPGSPVEYLEADLLAPPFQWRERFDFVLAGDVLEQLTPRLRLDAWQSLADLLAPGGTLLLLCRGRDRAEPPGEPPCPLHRDELRPPDELGLQETSFEDFHDSETPPVRRFRVELRRID